MPLLACHPSRPLPAPAPAPAAEAPSLSQSSPRPLQYTYAMAGLNYRNRLRIHSARQKQLRGLVGTLAQPVGSSHILHVLARSVAQSTSGALGHIGARETSTGQWSPRRDERNDRHTPSAPALLLPWGPLAAIRSRLTRRWLPLARALKKTFRMSLKGICETRCGGALLACLLPPPAAIIAIAHRSSRSKATSERRYSHHTVDGSPAPRYAASGAAPSMLGPVP